MCTWMAEGDNTSPTDGERERSVPKQDWKKMINSRGFGNQVAIFSSFFYFYLIRRKGRGELFQSNKTKKRKLPSHKSLCCHRHDGVIKEDPSTITAAAGSLHRRSDNGPGGKWQRACGPGIVRKTDKETQEQVISQFMGWRPAQTLTCPAGEEKANWASY